MRIERDDVYFQGQVTYANLPSVPIDTFNSSVTPEVLGRNTLIASGAVVTITNFLHPIDGQRISILGDGTTTISNNTTIKTNTGANKLLALNKVYRFTYYQLKGFWVEDA